jgi:hypothetical protein
LPWGIPVELEQAHNAIQESLDHFLRNIFFGQKTQLDPSADEKIVFLYSAQFALMRKTGQLPQLFTNWFCMVMCHIL